MGGGGGGGAFKPVPKNLTSHDLIKMQLGRQKAYV